jgi:TonB family protein
MRTKWLTTSIVMFVISSAAFGNKPGESSPPYAADLGMKKTAWGILHSFDRMRADTTVPPQYPLQDLRKGITAGVVLAVLVDEEGVVADVQVLKSGGSRRFENAATRAVRQWKYRPLEPRERFVTIQPITFDRQ